MMTTFEAARKAYPCEDKIYLNTAGTGLVAESVVSANHAFWLDLKDRASSSALEFRDNDTEQIRKQVADFIGTDVSRVAFVANFSTGLNFFLSGVDRSSRVLLYRHDYPSVTLPFELGGYDIRYMDHESDQSISTKKIEELIRSENIDIVALTQVQYSNGFKIDIAELSRICRENDATLIVDGTQSIGLLDLNFDQSGIDLLIWSNYKWMNAGFGTGVMCMNESTFKKYAPKVGGFASYLFDRGEPYYEPTMRTFEPGHLNMSGLKVLSKAIDHKLSLGVANIEKHVQQLMDTLTAGLLDLGVELVGGPDMPRAGIICIKASEELVDFLTKNEVYFTHRFGAIRLSLHFYNSSEDVDRFLQIVKGFQS